MPFGEHYDDMEENPLKVIFKIRPHVSCECCNRERNQCTSHSTNHSQLLLQGSTGHSGHGHLHAGALNQQANTARSSWRTHRELLLLKPVADRELKKASAESTWNPSCLPVSDK